MLHYVLFFCFLYYYIIIILLCYYIVTSERALTRSHGCTICSGNIPSQRAMVVRFVPGTFLHKELWLYDLFREHSFRKSYGTLAWLYDLFREHSFTRLYDLFREHSFTKSYGCTFCSGNIPSERALARSHGCTIVLIFYYYII